jgi:hypothetical protein
VGANVVEDRLCIYLQTCANTNVEPSGHRNAQDDKKWGPCLRTLFGRRALRVAITTVQKECELGEEGRRIIEKTRARDMKA